MAEHKTLPPLPGSTEDDFKNNRRDPFYGKTPKEVWVAAQIEHPPVVRKDKCPHRFRYTKEGVECEMCNMGLLGKGLTIRGDGLYFKEQKLL
jgi:hypothetical protein